MGATTFYTRKDGAVTGPGAAVTASAHITR